MGTAIDRVRSTQFDLQTWPYFAPRVLEGKTTWRVMMPRRLHRSGNLNERAIYFPEGRQVEVMAKMMGLPTGVEYCIASFASGSCPYRNSPDNT